MGCDANADVTQNSQSPVWVWTQWPRTCDTQYSWGWGDALLLKSSDIGGRGLHTGGLQVKQGYKLKACTGENETGSCYWISGRGVHGTLSPSQPLENNLGTIRVYSLPSNPTPYVTNSLTPLRNDTSGVNPAGICPEIGDTEEVTGNANGGQIQCKYLSINDSLTPTQLDNYFPPSEKNRWLNGGGRCARLTTADYMGPTWSQACKTALGNDDYNLQLINRCAADTSFAWINNAQVVNALKDIVRTSAPHNDLVLDLFQTYCGGSPVDTKSLGGHRTDVRCACINASNFGITGTSNCFNDNIKNFPGCATTNYYGSSTTPHIGLYDKFGPIIRYPDKNLVNSALASFNASPGCLVEACGVSVAGANTGDLMLPLTASTCPSVNMQFCGININVGAAQDSPINAECNQTQITNPPAGTTTGTPAGTTTGASPGATPTTGSPGGAPPPTDTLWPPDKVPGIDTKNKQIGLLIFIFIICCCCCLMLLGIGVAGTGGGNSAPAAPNYSANIAKLGRLAASL